MLGDACRARPARGASNGNGRRPGRTRRCRRPRARGTRPRTGRRARACPDITTRPPARVACSAVSSDCLLPTASTATSTPPRRYGAENSGLSWNAPVERRTRRSTSSGADDLGGAQLERQLALVAVLGDHDDLAGRGQLAQGERGEQPDRPGAADEHPVVGAYAGAQRGVHGAGHRLDQQRLLVGVALGDHVHLAAVRRQLLAPAAAGVLAEPGLEAGRQVADGDPAAPVGGAGRAVLAGLHAAGGAGQHRVEHDPGAGRQVLAVVQELADDLVAGHERQRHEGGEVEAGLAGQRAEVGAADAGQPGADPGPARAGRPWAGRW